MPPKAPIFRDPEIGAAFAAILGKVGDKQADREKLTPGAAYPFELAILGEISKRRVAIQLEGVVTVDHDKEGAVTSAPKASIVLAWFLWKLHPEVRKTNLLALKRAFDEAELQPDVPAEFTELADETLKSLRKTVQDTSRGAVRLGQYSLSKPARAEID